MKDPVITENAISELTQHVENLQRDLAAALERIRELERRPQYVPFPVPFEPVPNLPPRPFAPAWPVYPPAQPWYIGDPPNYVGPTCGYTILCATAR